MNRRALLAGGASALVLPCAAAGPAAALAFQLRDREGRAIEAATLLGRLTLVHFWASWCASCRTEFPALRRLHEDFGPKGLSVLAISVDRLGWPVIEATVSALDVRSLPVFHDLNREAAAALKIEALPSTLIVDGDGREIERRSGAVDWDATAVRAELAARL